MAELAPEVMASGVSDPFGFKKPIEKMIEIGDSIDSCVIEVVEDVE